MKLKASLASTTSRATSIFIIGLACFGMFVCLASRAITETWVSTKEEAVVAAPAPTPTPKPTRYVAPAEIQLPIY